MVAAYGWPADIRDEELPSRLLDLDLERAEASMTRVGRWSVTPDSCPEVAVLGRTATRVGRAEWEPDHTPVASEGRPMGDKGPGSKSGAKKPKGGGKKKP